MSKKKIAESDTQRCNEERDILPWRRHLLLVKSVRERVFLWVVIFMARNVTFSVERASPIFITDRLAPCVNKMRPLFLPTRDDRKVKKQKN